MRRTAWISCCTIALLAASAARAEVAIRRLDFGQGTAQATAPAAAPGAGLTALQAATLIGKRWAVPYWTSADPEATTTLFAITNPNEGDAAVEIRYRTVTNALTLTENVMVPGHGMLTVNLRDKLGLGISAEGIAFFTSNLDVLVDTFMVETGAERAVGSFAVNTDFERCAILLWRAFRGGASELGTELVLHIQDPQGPNPETQPPSLFIFVWEADGDFVDGLAFWTNQVVEKIDFQEIVDFLELAEIDYKIEIWGNNADVAEQFGVLPPSVAVKVAGMLLFNAGPTFNVGDKLVCLVL